MAKQIRRVAVLGAGVMGSGIAAHLANAGIDSLLYDIVPPDARDSDDPKARNAFALKGIETAVKIKPAAFMRKSDAKRITPCNYDDHADLLKTCDWVVEVVVERLDIKNKVFDWVEANAAPDAVISSNTSGIPLAEMAAQMSEGLRKRFLITHFFNPVRYMRLLELVAGPDTDPEIVARVADFGERKLGKGIVYGKDTPNFVANRIGTFGIGATFQRMVEHGATVPEVDAVFGPAMGRPKSAVFRTADLVGIDTLAHVFGNVLTGAPNDERLDAFEVPAFVQKLIDAGAVGAKAGAGFYKKEGRNILALDLETGEYGPSEKVRYPSLGAAKKAGSPGKAVKAVCAGDDKAAKLAWDVTADTLIYSANRIPEIADDVVNIDRGMRWGFGWDLGPFETWDALGVRESVERMQSEGRTVPQWVLDMLEAGRESFYVRDDSGSMTFWQHGGGAAKVPTSDRWFFISDAKANGSEIERNASASLHDMGDGVLLLEFHSKMNALDNLINDMANKGMDMLDEGRFDALVVGNQDPKAFCAGANILAIVMAAAQQQWDQIDGQVNDLQQLLQRFKYSDKPVVTAPHGLALGGGCEVAMQSAATVASGELYMGLVEVGVGLIPAGGGCKELLSRYLGDIPAGVDYDPIPFISSIFTHVGMAQVTSSAEEARQWGYLRPTDKVVLDIDARLQVAKQTARGLADGGYQAPRQRKFKLPGKSGLAAVELVLYGMKEGGYASEHDAKIGAKLGHVLTGGDIPAGTWRTEQDILDLEREVFLSLCGEPLTQARIQHMLTTGKPLRN
ncbi:MAG: 3-hydroxyacyl-CoA dehydrogenase/enoyl-CoA hydratase family protein [Deltaproteobacteria bacterium]|nr:MAG: 3-hydroxyacyl-CoA dehydrogenase/enoyl-CoA hydratase family protein [Deltaproteobacteria bacterium]